MRSYIILMAIQFIVFAISLSAQSAADMKTAVDVERVAVKAYETKAYADFLSNIQKANAARPNHPRLIYSLASADAVNGNIELALASLDRLAKMGLVYAIEKDEDFKALNGSEKFKDIQKRMAANRERIGTSIKAFEIADKTLIVESVAHNSKTGKFYIGSIHQRKLISVDKSGDASEFSSPTDGLWSVLGMKVDETRGFLWVASSAFPQMKGFTPEDKGRAGLFKYDLKTGKLVKKRLLPTGENHVLGDVLIARDGRIYATDSVSPEIYTVDPKTDEINLFLRSDLFASLQGLAFSPGEKQLYVADYSKGVFRIDIATKQITQLKPDENITLLGIDGLYFSHGKLIAIQNGINPNRVVSFTIDGDRITEFKTLEAGHPDFMEPTLGVLNGDSFYYVANSQWPLVNSKGELDAEKLRPPVILRMDIKKALAR